MVSSNHREIRWRATGFYLPTSVTKPALLRETRQFLLAYASTGDMSETRRAFASGELSQRSIYSRTTFARIIRMRLAAWNPPSWVLEDLVTFAGDGLHPCLSTALLLHLPRQDALLYDLIQRVVFSRWQAGERSMVRSDVQRFLDDSELNHPEIGGWTHATRAKVAGNVLTLLRDYGLLRGSSHSRLEKQIVEPVIPAAVVRHLVRLLSGEGVSGEEMADHSDWRLWLCDGTRARALMAAALEKEAVA